MLKRFRSLSQDDQVRLLAITDALAPAMLQDEESRSIEDSGYENNLIEFSSYTYRKK